MAEQAINLDPDDLSRIIMLAFGRMDTGGPYWCYVAVKPSRFDEFQRAMASKQYNMQNYVNDGFGETIVSGTGTTPPNEVTRQVAELFDVPIRQLFADGDPKKTITNKIESLKKTENE